MKVKYSRTTDKTLSLAERTRLANTSGASAFYSIHANSFTKTTAKGVETFSSPGSTIGRKIASGVQSAILSDKSLYTVNRGLKTANFYVLRNTRMPAALTELAFISNGDDARILKYKQKELAKKIAEAIRRDNKAGSLIFLDAGHGGRDPGAIGNGMKEKDITLAVVLEVGRLLQGGEFKPSKPTKTPKPIKSNVSTNTLAVDGHWGKATTKALQRYLGLKADGVISGQYPNGVTRQIPSVSFSTRTGSNVIKALQKKIGASQDGYIGVGTVRALQKYLGTHIDGHISRPSLMVKELQRRLNKGNL